MWARIRWALLAVLCTVVGLSAGQDKDAKSGPRPDANTIEVRFADDSIVKMVLQHSTIEVATRYGKLSVPVQDMRRIELGMRIPEATAKRIEAAIAGLGNSDFKKRDAAGIELIGLRELAYPALLRAARSSDPEVSRRAEEAIKTIAEKVPPEKLHLPQHDTVVTTDFTIVGQVEAPTLKARTPYFGETNLKLAEVRTLRWLANGRESKVVVDAGRYGGQQELWMDTSIEIRPGMNLTITASGTIDLMPAQPGNILASPDGMGQRGPGVAGFGNMPGQVLAKGAGARGGRAQQQQWGSLIGRIGQNGRTFLVGTKYEGIATEDGKLYLRIMPSPYNADSSGTFDVQVNSER
ncbi:MAG TPA: hypothetical protein VGP68_09050 [Gemmataceae bacterium]|jgi:hypothetical protein|nr:hypothetical protein [Gemmataceae bacterium]